MLNKVIFVNFLITLSIQIDILLKIKLCLPGRLKFIKDLSE